MNDLSWAGAVQSSPIPDGYCKCGCGNKTTVSPRNVTRYGYVKGKPRDYLRGHQFRRAALYEVTDAGCWQFCGRLRPDGYGDVYWEGRNHLAHRWLYERLVGPIPAGLQLDHLCRNRGCLNPEHLEPVTNAENQRRGLNTKLNVEIVREVRQSPEDALALSRQLNVTRQAIYDIRSGKTWADV